MAKDPNPSRPISPHLTAYKWGPHMAVSIIHRATGTGVAVLGTILFVAWLVALAKGGTDYDQFVGLFTLESGALNLVGYLVGVPLTWAIFQHMGSGVRHLFMDEGANFELGGNKATAIATFAFSILATAGFWLVILEKTNG